MWPTILVPDLWLIKMTEITNLLQAAEACIHRCVDEKRQVLMDTKSRHLCLWEHDENVDMKVKIVGVPDKLIAIRMEAISHMHVIKPGQRTKICDYILMADVDDCVHMILIEMKKTYNEKNPKRRAENQLRSSLPILKYIHCICFLEQTTSVISCLTKTHYWVFCEKDYHSLDKQSTAGNPIERIRSILYKNIEIKIYSAPQIPFRALIGQK